MLHIVLHKITTGLLGVEGHASKSPKRRVSQIILKQRRISNVIYIL
jgi:hypothetical protein